MRIPTQPLSSIAAFCPTPLIDVVFLLVLFFLLSSQLTRQETQLALPLPPARSGQAESRMDRPRLTVNLLADGTLLVANRTLSIEELAALLAERRSVLGSNLEIRIRSDRSVPYSRVEPLILACSRANITNITFATTPPLTNGK